GQGLGILHGGVAGRHHARSITALSRPSPSGFASHSPVTSRRLDFRKDLSMRRMRFVVLASFFALAAAALVTRPTATPPAETPPLELIPLETIHYDDLTERVVKLQGKVVVVDFWADFCLPCKKEFPHLVDLQRKYADKGLAAVSVCLTGDDIDDELRQRVRRFLTNQKATFANYLLDEKPQVW